MHKCVSKHILNWNFKLLRFKFLFSKLQAMLYSSILLVLVAVVVVVAVVMIIIHNNNNNNNNNNSVDTNYMYMYVSNKLTEKLLRLLSSIHNIYRPEV